MQQREGDFTQAERNKMLLSNETQQGLKITGISKVKHVAMCYAQLMNYIVKSFVEVARFLLGIEGVGFLLSERFCHPLEAFFGNQRAKGGRSDNPTVKQFCTSTVSLRVQGSAALAPLRGNCKRQTSNIEVDETPLPKRQRESKKK